VVWYDRADRAAGEPKQTLFRLIKYAMDAIFSFSYKPLRLGVALGTLVFPVVLLLAAIRVAAGLFGLSFAGATSGFNATFWTVLLMGSVQLICTGLLGEYIGRIYDEVRRRPLYLIHQLHQSEPHRKTMAAGVSEARELAEASQPSQSNGSEEVGDLVDQPAISSLASSS
jgi:dolichol-phosphate mannosyltransferase